MTIPRPDNLSTPFANSAGTLYINEIPVPDPVDPQLASWTSGFRPITMTPKASGGLPPFGQDINGVLNAISQHTRFTNAGGQYRFDAALSTILGGYDAGTVLQSDDGRSSYVSTIDGNTINFNTTPSSIGNQWLPWAGNSSLCDPDTVGYILLPVFEANNGDKSNLLVQWGLAVSDVAGFAESTYQIPYTTNPIVFATDVASGTTSFVQIVSVNGSNPLPLTKAQFFATDHAGNPQDNTGINWLSIGRKS